MTNLLGLLCMVAMGASLFEACKWGIYCIPLLPRESRASRADAETMWLMAAALSFVVASKLIGSTPTLLLGSLIFIIAAAGYSNNDYPLQPWLLNVAKANRSRQ